MRVLPPRPRHRQLQILAAYEGHGAARSQIDGCVFHHIVGGEQRHVLEIRERPAHQPDALLHPCPRGRHPVQHHDHPASVMLGAAHHAEPAGIGVARLQPVRHAPLHERIAVVLDDTVIGKRLFRIVVIVLGKILDDPFCKRGDVAHRHVVRRIGPSRAVAEHAVLHAERLGLRVHHFDELLLRSGNPLGQHDAGIVAGLDDHAADQHFDRDLRAQFHEHL